MSDSSVALGSGSTGTTTTPVNSTLYSGVCQHRLPCGYCNLRNMMCPVNNFTITIPCKPTTASISGEYK